jgi:hypothetical protein
MGRISHLPPSEGSRRINATKKEEAVVGDKHEPGQHGDSSHDGSGASFEQAAERIRTEIRRLDDLEDDVRRRVREIRWQGRSADYFRRHAAFQAVRARDNRELLESLRVLLLNAAHAANVKVDKP